VTPEFSRPERADTIGVEPRTVTVAADETERHRLADRFGIVALERLEATFTLRRDAAGVLAEGRVGASVTQACSVTGEPIAASVDEPVSLRFVEPVVAGDEIELDDGAIDTIEIEDGTIDLGEAAAETLALALDPYPRSPAAEAALREAGVKREDEVENAAFGGLAALRDRLGG
jgi:uncharacterized metal-binding protein YceD (DUF177 family)